jgi:hypothetical protein
LMPPAYVKPCLKRHKNDAAATSDERWRIPTRQGESFLKKGRTWRRRSCRRVTTLPWPPSAISRCSASSTVKV